MKLQGAVGLVTGGASGLGRGVVEMLVESGGRAVVVDLPGDRLDEVASRFGDAVLTVPTDITDPAQVTEVFEAAVERFGGVTLCVNCAGRADAARTYKNGTMFSLETFRAVLDVNLVGLFDVVRNAARVMSANEPDELGERGVIVNVASIAGYEGQAGQAAYSSSKGGVIALTLPLARDLASLGVRVCAVAPGIFDTAMLADTPAQVRERMLDVHVFPRRLGLPTDFAGLVRTIAENPMLNGEVIRLDAGARLGHG